MMLQFMLFLMTGRVGGNKVLCLDVFVQLSCCLTALIKTEQEAEVRRAAVHVIALLLRGLSHKTTQVPNTHLVQTHTARQLTHTFQ